MLVLFLLDVLGLTAAQHPLRARAGPWRHKIQWENNGQVYSLLSTGSQYRSPAQVRRRTQVLLRTNNSSERLHSPGELRGASRTRSEDANSEQSSRNGVSQSNSAVLGADAAQYLLASGRPGRQSQVASRTAALREADEYRSARAQVNGSSAAFTTFQEFSGTGVPRGGRSTPRNNGGAQRAGAPAITSHSFTQSRGGRFISIAENSESTMRLPGTTRRAAMAEDPGSERRTPPPTSPGDARVAQGAQPSTRMTPEANATTLSSNAVEIHIPLQRPGTTQITDTSDPRDPHSIHHRNSVFYELYPPDRRNRITVRPPPGPGYGTRFFHNGEAVNLTHVLNTTQKYIYMHIL